MSESTASMDANIVKPMIHDFHVAGLSHIRGGKENLLALEPDAEFTLVPEPTNAFDRNAVLVMYEGINLLKIGYIPGPLAPTVCAIIADGRLVKCRRRPGSKSGTGMELHYLPGEGASE